MNASVFQRPGAEFRGVALWMLNDRIELQEAERQLRGFHEAGWGAVITRTYLGTRITYLSEEWLRLVDRIVEVSKEQGTRVFLQEADTKVGGYVTTALLGMEDRFRHRRLVMVEEEGGEAGVAGRGPLAVARHGQAAPPNSRVVAEQEVTQVGGPALRCRFYEQMVVPPGESSQFFAVMDLLDEETVREFMRRCHDAQAARHGEEFGWPEGSPKGKTVEAIWMDEPFLRFRDYTRLPVLPWTPRLPDLFAKEWGYSILDHLPSLFLEVGDFPRIRHHFWRTVVGQFKKAYWEPIGRWCAAHGVKFAGHLMGEDTMHDQIGWSGAIMRFYEDMQLPGIDYLTKEIDIWRPVGSKFIIAPKQCSSVANQLGKPEVLSEMYGVSDQGLTFADRKWIAEWLAVLGINYRCYHAAFYSLRGARKRMYPPHIGHQQPYWPHNRMIADAMARLSYALRQGKYAADVLVLHPLESAQCLFTPLVGEERGAAGVGTPALQEMDRTLISISDNLLAIHRGFDYGDEYLLDKYGKAEGSLLRVGEMAYRVVVLPGLITMRGSTRKLLSAFLDGGGMVLSVGELPSRVDGALDSRTETLNTRVLSVENTRPALKEHLDRHSPPGLELIGPGTDDVWVHERRLAGERIIFLVNTSRSRRAEGELRVRAAGELTAWNLFDGRQGEIAQWSNGGQVCTRLTFAPTESHLLALREGEAAPRPGQADKRCRARVVVAREIPLDPVFQLTRRDPNALTLDFCRYRLGDGDPPAPGLRRASWSDLRPVIGILEMLTRQRYSGPVQLQYRFSAEVRPAACAIVVEDSENCRVEISGTEVSRRGDAWFWDRGFHRIDVTEHVRVGENVVELSRDYHPPDPDAIRDHERFYGTDLESIYVIGDFAVRGRGLDSFRLAQEESVTTGELASNGYPFYAGSVTLAQELELARPGLGERVFLDFGELHAAIALIRVNGRECGPVLWPPYRSEITGAIKDGVNHIEIDLVNTLRNLLGPHHYTGPEKNQVWQTHFTAVMEDQDWMAPGRRVILKTWSDAYECVPFGVGRNARIVYQTEGG